MSTMKYTVGVLFGGPSGEYDVSCNSAHTIVEGLLAGGHTVIPIGVSRDARWYAPVKPEDVQHFEAAGYAAQEVYLPQYPGSTLYDRSTHAAVCTLDVVFPIIHGTYGEDGHVQGMFEMIGMPFVGAGMAASVVGMDKVYMRDLLAGYGIDQVRYMSVLRSQWQAAPEQVLDAVEAKLPYPIFVKPANLGSSVGISKAENRQALADALALAARYDRKLLLEEGLDVREIELSVMGNDTVRTAVPGEILSAGAFYDYDSKYINAASRTIVPADLTEEQQTCIIDIAQRAYRILDMNGMCRADFFIDKKSGRILLNEVNTLPGFTNISMYAMMWHACGVELPQLLDDLLALAFERAEDQALTAALTRGD